MGFLDSWSNTRENFTPTILMVAIFGTFGSMTFAYDAGWWGAALGHVTFNNYYGILKTSTGHHLAPFQQSCGTALGTAGTMIGCMIAGWAARALGRRNTMILLACIALCGSTIQLTSVIGSRSGPTKFWQLVVGKIVVNSSVGIATTVVPLYLSETSPAKIRGFMVCFHNIAEGVGGIFANATVYGLQNRRTRIVWMLPIGLQMVIPVFMILGARMLPESPRWLIETNQYDRAVASMIRLRKGLPDADPEAEVIAIQEAIRHHEQVIGGSTFFDLFKGTNLRRTMITVAMTCLQQGMGISMVNNYLVIMLAGIGIAKPIIFSLGLGCLQLATMLFFMSFAPDKYGRRPLLLIGATMMGTALFIVGGISAATNNHPSHILQRTTVGMFFVWAFAFAFSWGPLSWTTMAETPSAAVREMTMALGAWSGFGVGMTVNFVQPYISAAIGARSAFVYASIAPFAIAFTYFLIPEYKGRSLEQVDEMFDARVPARKFRTYQCSTHLQETHEDVVANEQEKGFPNDDDKVVQNDQTHLERA